MLSESLHLERGKAREQSVNDAVDVLMRLPNDKRFTLEVEEVRQRLPRNLLARLKIPVRKMAKHLDLSYEQERGEPKEYAVRIEIEELDPVSELRRAGM